MIKEIANAKINLALEVMDEYAGYHKVKNLMIPIALHDEIILDIDSDVKILNCDIPDNICVKAAKLFLGKYNISSGVKITLNKNIPSSAGLAGGSSDAAAVLRGLNKLYNINASNEELMDLASSLGSDVPFFINTRLALCTGRGEIINPIDINYKSFNILLIKPSVGISTKAVYQAYKYENIDRDNNFKNIYKALENDDIELLKNNFFNDLNKYSLNLCSELNELYSKIKNNNIDVFISGSGPTMFVINPSDDEINLIKKLIDNDTFISKTKII